MSLIQSLVILLTVAVGAHALNCWDGDEDYTRPQKCNSDVKFCAIWYDYTSGDDFYFCDDSDLCKSEGFKNQTFFSIYCCKENLCNDIATGSSTPTYSNPPSEYTTKADYTTATSTAGSSSVVTTTPDFLTSSTEKVICLN
ncbi:hypothetical protein M3Y97_01165200 [Aphelenchoides bicaudatus]|nr:hypothetical protein M3Y97_01165200 [Aphelenchoides bicaudatus]